jgi:hypothetical protein
MPERNITRFPTPKNMKKGRGVNEINPKKASS